MYARELAVRALCALSLSYALAGAAGPAHAADPGAFLGALVDWADPAPLGISYEWTVTMAAKQKAGLVGYVGAKSWNEPSNPDGLKGWTHTSNWVALDLTEPAKLKITMERQQGVTYASGLNVVVARAALYPALSLYSGWDDTSDEDHTYNNSGDFWSTIQFLDNEPNWANKKGQSKTKIVFATKKLAAGHYSIALGGNPPALANLGDYPASNCDPTDDLCYVYTGQQGYRVTIETK